jgi:hypothetical protein
MLRAYALSSTPNKNPVSIKQVAEIQQIHEGSVSACNPFYVDISLITKTGHKFIPAEEVFSYAQRLQWNDTNAGYKLAPLLKKTWFAETICPKLQLRSISEEYAIKCLSEASSAPPSSRLQLLMLLDYLEHSGLIVRENDSIRLGASYSEQNDSPFSDSAATTVPPKPPEEAILKKEVIKPSSEEYEAFEIQIPEKLPAKFFIPKNLTQDDWELFNKILQVYLDRMKKIVDKNKGDAQ